MGCRLRRAFTWPGYAGPMPGTIPFVQAPLRGLPLDPDDTWHLAVRRIPAWVKDRASPAGYSRPRIAVCLGRSRGEPQIEVVHAADDGDVPPDAVARVLEQLSRSAGALPARIEAESEADAEAARAALKHTGVVVEVKPASPVVDAMIADMEAALNSGERRPIPPLMSVPGMTIDRIRAFAEAAALYARARPREWVRGEALMRIDPPVSDDPGLSHCIAIGELGDCAGLSFHTGPGQVEECAGGPEAFWESNTRVVWAIWLEELPDLPFADADLWLDHDLPVAGKSLYPLAHGTRDGRTSVRPDAARLTAMEAVLRACAAGSREEQEAGSWTRDVPTFDGPRTVTLREVAMPMIPARQESGPRLLIPAGPAGPNAAEGALFSMLAGGTTRARRGKKGRDREAAQALCYEAMEAGGDARAADLCRQALEIDPDSCDALTMLAQVEAGTAGDLIDRLQGAVEAGERSLGTKAFAADRGHFWGLLETRPYMRARAWLADELRGVGRLDEAVAHWRAMLDLNPADNQGVRYPLLGALMTRPDWPGPLSSGSDTRRTARRGGPGDASCCGWPRRTRRAPSRRCARPGVPTRSLSPT